jgi:hypothetical protein
MKHALSFVLGIAVGIGALFGLQKFLPDLSGSKIIVSNNVEGTIQDIGQLATAEYVYTVTQTADKESLEVLGIKLPFTSSRVIYSYSGVIKAGIEFGEVKVKVNDSNKTITVTLPDPIQISNEIDNDSLMVYDEKYSLFNTFTFSDMNMSQEELKKAAETSSAERGLFDNAIVNAKTIIESNIYSMYSKDEYTIHFN